MSDKSGNTENQCQLFETGDVETVDLVKYVHWLRDDNNPFIQLPPLQRGDVWKVAQVERLWDSVLRGFPIGSFLLAPSKAGAPARSLISPEQKPAARDGWFLLDGQQHTRALMLGFPPKKQTACLWIDMAPQTLSMLDRAFLFRLCTEQHPWGMQQNEPDRKIEDYALLDARRQLREVRPEKAEDVKLHHDYGLSPDYTWPVRSTLPVPFADLVARVDECKRQSGNVCAIKWDDLLPKSKSDNLGKHPKSSDQSILAAIAKMLERKVVLLKLDPEADPFHLEQTGAPDAMETLFERVNSAGTRLEGEVMMFSLLKAKWSGAYTLVQTIADHDKAGLLPPTGIVLSATRLARAQLIQSGNSGDDEDVAKPKVRQFRRWIAEKAVDGGSDGPFLLQMKRFIDKQQESGEPRFVHIVLDFLKVAQYREGDDIGLPRPLLLALDRYAIDVVLRWIDIRRDSHNFGDVLAESRLPILRFLIHSLLAWTHPEKASRRAFSVLSCEGNDQFPDMKIYEGLIKEEEGPPVALTMPGSRDMEKCVIPPQGNDDWRGLRSYQELFSSVPHGEFVRRFWNKKEMLLWFQRARLDQLFRDYDPLKMRSSSPFDYDHILPSSHLLRQGKSPTFEENMDAEESGRFLDNRWLYRDSIGNYRIWPGWLTRSDQDSAPDKKFRCLHQVGDLASNDQLREIGFKNRSEICPASAIPNNHIELWQKASGDLLDWKNPERRKGFQCAVESRVVSLYKSLYDALEYRDWLPRDGSSDVF